MENSLKYCQSILPKVSRTFALGINALGRGETHLSVLTGYLFCRIIDTIEDDKRMPAHEKAKSLEQFKDLLNNYSDAKCNEFTQKTLLGMAPKEHDASLFFNSKQVFKIFQSLSFRSQDILKKWVSEMAFGMAEFVTRYPLGIRIQSLEEYRRYCYYVAGTVGHLLTDIWKESSILISKSSYHKLKSLAEPFGEALQTTNILKDILWDYKEEQAIFFPEEILTKHGSSHAHLFSPDFAKETKFAMEEMLKLARDDVRFSLEYIRHIPHMCLRIRLFCSIPILLAIPTLKKLQINNPKSLYLNETVKLSREEVRQIISRTWRAVLSNNLLKKEVISLS